MTTQIWKFPLELREEQEIEMPENANIIHVAEQHERICLWAEVYPKDIKRKRTFYVIGTGWLMPNLSTVRHIGSVVMAPGAYVWHVYQKIEHWMNEEKKS